jgi:hypothetical protein
MEAYLEGFYEDASLSYEDPDGLPLQGNFRPGSEMDLWGFEAAAQRTGTATFVGAPSVSDPGKLPLSASSSAPSGGEDAVGANSGAEGKQVVKKGKAPAAEDSDGKQKDPQAGTSSSLIAAARKMNLWTPQVRDTSRC